MGFPAILPGKPVEKGAQWTWKGELLNFAGCDQLVATFTFQEIVEIDGEACARITGKISGWPEGVNPECACETFFSLKRGLPVKASYRYKSKSRTNRIEARLAGSE